MPFNDNKVDGLDCDLCAKIAFSQTHLHFLRNDFKHKPCWSDIYVVQAKQSDDIVRRMSTSHASLLLAPCTSLIYVECLLLNFQLFLKKSTWCIEMQDIHDKQNQLIVGSRGGGCYPFLSEIPNIYLFIILLHIFCAATPPPPRSVPKSCHERFHPLTPH